MKKPKEVPVVLRPFKITYTWQQTSTLTMLAKDEEDADNIAGGLDMGVGEYIDGSCERDYHDEYASQFNKRPLKYRIIGTGRRRIK